LNLFLLQTNCFIEERGKGDEGRDVFGSKGRLTINLMKYILCVTFSKKSIRAGLQNVVAKTRPTPSPNLYPYRY
jgi:hypothetical protein